MIQTVRRLAGPALVATLALGAAACGGGSDDSANTGASTGASADPTPSATGSSEPASSPPTTPSETVAAAAGPELAQTVVAVKAPTGWEPDSAPAEFSSAARGPGRSDSLLLIDNASLAGPDATIDDLYASFVSLNKGDKRLTYERLPDLDLQGTPASYVHSTRKGTKSEDYVVTAVRSGRVVSLTFTLDPGTLAQDPQLVESVLATLRWLG
ncbi:hypothetical protein G5V58_21610 [Nocardioides anomalus]|uniref:DUF1795 domain-containing protein n=1 Tax=Nocardioides anomalus TaxID=2712223 RepID=A0A6G6WIY4_9ACTN|nr:hypothetical protein [Nocardioides anomalus]QIG45020.1 hypothetical protein G5V58_21610 [Nocardioides anomalus]